MIWPFRPRTLKSIPIDVDPEPLEPERVKARVRRIVAVETPQTMAATFKP